VSLQPDCYLLMKTFLWFQYSRGLTWAFGNRMIKSCYEVMGTANITVLTTESQTAMSLLHHFITVLL